MNPDLSHKIERALKAAIDACGPQRAGDAARLRLRLAMLYLNQERYAEMDELDLPAILPKLADERDRALAKVSIARLHLNFNDFYHADRYLFEALEYWRDHSGAQGATQEYAITLFHIATSAIKQQQYMEACNHLEKCLPMIESTLGAGSALFAHALGSLGVVHFENGDSQMAADVLGAALPRFESHYGNSHPGTARLRLTLAKALRHCGHAAEIAEPIG